MRKSLLLGLFTTLLLTLAACGQKGPLIVEQQPIEAPKTQDEELAPVK